MKTSIRIKIFDIVFLSIFIITASLGYLSFSFSRSRLTTMLGESLKAIAATTANFIKAEDVTTVKSNIEGIRERNLASKSPVYSDVYEKSGADRKAEHEQLSIAFNKYTRYAEMLANVQKVNRMNIPINVYTKNGNRLEILFSSDSAVLLGSPYTMRPEANKVFEDNKPRATKIYRDRDGVWISAYAPVAYSFLPVPTAVVEATYRIDMYMGKLRRELATILFACLVGFILTAVIAYNLVNKVAGSIKKLDKAAGELEKENYSVRIDVKTEDEIGHLAETFEKLKFSIRKKMDELKSSVTKEKKAHLESIKALTNMIELRDPYTKEHLARVEKYALLIAREMHLDKHEIEKLRYGCYLHDIGKIYIENDLLKKARLSVNEREHIKKHAENGAKIIEGIPFLKDINEIILYHQERYDGSGYPKGLKGDEIPLLARVVAVADTFDAMTTDRPYKKKVGFDEAMDVIEKESGRQFDPVVAQALLKYRPKIEKMAKKHFLA